MASRASFAKSEGAVAARNLRASRGKSKKNFALAKTLAEANKPTIGGETAKFFARTSEIESIPGCCTDKRTCYGYQGFHPPPSRK